MLSAYIFSRVRSTRSSNRLREHMIWNGPTRIVQPVQYCFGVTMWINLKCSELRIYGWLSVNFLVTFSVELVTSSRRKCDCYCRVNCNGWCKWAMCGCRGKRTGASQERVERIHVVKDAQAGPATLAQYVYCGAEATGESAKHHAHLLKTDEVWQPW